MEFITLLVLILFTDLAGSIAPGFFHERDCNLEKAGWLLIVLMSFSPERVGKILVEF